MRVLLVHNFYRSAIPSGENTVFESERDLLRAAGHQVFEYTRSNDEILHAPLRVSLEAALLTPWNFRSKARFDTVLKRCDPDIVHVHNTFPLISPAVFWAAQRSRAGVVQTLHNYRVFCSSATALRDGQPCMLCRDEDSVKPALMFKCYRGSRIATTPVAGMIALHKRLHTWQTKVNAFVALTDFQRKNLVSAGLPADRTFVKPNFTPSVAPPKSWAQREDKAVFVGRLDYEKGCDLLLQAWALWGRYAPRLELIGDGGQTDSLKALINQLDLGGKVEMTGVLGRQETLAHLASAKLLVLPSRFLEGMPMVVLEAFSSGVPVLASALGALSSIVTDGYTGHLFEAGNVEALASALRQLWQNQENMEKMARHARAQYDQLYSPSGNLSVLLDIYGRAIANKAEQDGAATSN